MSIKPNNELHQLLSTGRPYKIPKGQMVQSSDARYRPLVNIIKSGYIKRYEINNDGTKSIQCLYGPGYVFPLTQAFKSILDQELYDGPEVIYWGAVTDVEIYSMDAELLKQNMDKNPRLYHDLLREAGIRIHSNLQRLENLSLKNSYKQTAHQLLYYAQQFGKNKNSNVVIQVRLTHQDLADILSLTRETVTTNMNKLQKLKIIKTSQNIEILNLEKLEHEAYN